MSSKAIGVYGAARSLSYECVLPQLCLPELFLSFRNHVLDLTDKKTTWAIVKNADPSTRCRRR